MSKILNDLGYYPQLDKLLESEKLDNPIIGRVIKQSKQNYIVKTELGNYNGKISGKLRHNSKEHSDYPAVGDWIIAKIKEDTDIIIHKVLPRKTVIERKAIGRFGKKQTIATNVDYCFVMQDIANDFNLNRLDRLVSICFSSNITPFLIFTKIDLLNKRILKNRIKEIKKQFINITLITISNKTKLGLDEVFKNIKYSNTYCFIGASGAGKSSLINHLVGSKVMVTKAVKENNHKGQHTTSHRELFVLNDSGILIDTPGMRELGIADSIKTLESTFKTIFNLSRHCKFSDCTHLKEPDCAVLIALDKEEILKSYYDNFHKMKREQIQFNLNKRGIKDKEMIKILKSDPKHRKS